MPVTSLAYGGSGIGHHNGKVCFIPFTAPGDIVKIRIIKEKRSHLFGTVTEFVERSPIRVSPPCPIFGLCGGCQWQHLPYPEQVRWKEQIFRDTLWRFGRVPAERVDSVLPSPLPYNYRSRVQFKLRSVEGKLHLGFYRQGSHFVQDLPDGCAIAHPTVNFLVPSLRAMIQRFEEPDKIPQVDVSVGDDGQAIVLFHYIGENRSAAVSFFGEETASIGSCRGVFLQSGRKSTITRIAGDDHLSYILPQPSDREGGTIRLIFSRGGFSQINYQQNVNLVKILRQWCQGQTDGSLLDIFCGNGNFSLPLADRYKEITGIESYEPSILDARENLRINGIGNAEYRAVDAIQGVQELLAKGKHYDTVILDPPRTGAADVVPMLPLLKPNRIIYISCDPVTLARDLSCLQKDYEVVATVPVDMFPQTYHLESISLLKRR